ncbi:MAG TPA: AAA family ATPase, partial [Candidatus Pacearchaeota archaeon]|nr:AAA family ATPase [Candidatus Pacearchaeota archaeon]
DKENTCIILAATNRPDMLDPALLRPGRFDRRVVFDLPDINSREEILKIHSSDKKLEENINYKEIAERTPGFSGADLAALLNEAALLAVKHSKLRISQKEILESIDKVLLGPERKSHLLNAKEKKISAYHEVGHALVNHILHSEREAVRKISIISRGMAGGYTLTLPKEEQHFKTKSEFIGDIATLLGGYCAEELVFNEVTTGASNDLQVSSEIARNLVKDYGMSSLGPITYGIKQKLVYLKTEYSENQNYSEKIAEKIDEEIQNIVKEAKTKATSILAEKKPLLEKIAKILIEKETIEREEFEALIAGKEGIRTENKSESKIEIKPKNGKKSA